MTNFIPIFPLGITVFPTENLNLHIFEPRYKQLIEDCFGEKKPFGIPTVLNNGIAELGTLLEITEVVEVHSDGKMDIRTKGLAIFSILEIIKQVPDKLYQGAVVSYPENSIEANPIAMAAIMPLVNELHKLLQVKKDFKKADNQLLSYDIAHHIGLSVLEEYELLQLYIEAQRLAYIKRHLQKIIPIIKGTEMLKERVHLNGHFKELSGFNL